MPRVLRLAALFVVLALAAPLHAEEVLVLKDGRRIAVTRMVRRDGNVLFETTKGERFSVPEGEVVSPPLESIPTAGAPPAAPPAGAPEQVLELKDGRRIAVRRLARRGEEVLFETTKGERFSVPAGDVVSPALDSIPRLDAPPPILEQVLELKDGRRIPVRRLARRGDEVLLETASGERFSVPAADVVSPALDTIPGVPGAPAPVPTPAPAPTPEPPAATPPAPPAPPPPVLPVSAYPLPDLKPLGHAGGVTVRPVAEGNAEFVPMPDRWRLGWPRFDRYSPKMGTPWVEGGTFDPYNQNVLKADYPVGGNDLFLNLNLQSNSNLNPRKVAATAAQDQLFYNQNFVAGFEVFKGDTVFRPKDWALRATVVKNFNLTAKGSFGFGDLERNEGRSTGLEEAFLEKRLGIVSPNFDAVSLRVGMQNFNSDFRGFLFADNQLGVRLFGNAAQNRHQYNLAVFSMREREAGSQLHGFGSREQTVVIANWFIQDFATRGYTFLLNVHHVQDKLNEAQVGKLSATYVGVHGDGRWGGWNVSHAFYQVFGTDDADGGRDLNARMAALELSRDADWKRLRLNAFYASGDEDPNDGKGNGFDAIMDNPNFAGGAFMFWTQQGQVLGQGRLKEKFSLLPNLRSKFTDRANFDNPGLVLLGGGLDLRLSPKLKVVTNASYLRLARNGLAGPLLSCPAGRTRPCVAVTDKGIGVDLSLGAKWRPKLNENLFFVFGASALKPRGGLQQALGEEATLFSTFLALQLAY